MRAIYPTILALIICCASYAQSSARNELASYGFDTTLKGGYSISFKVDAEQQYLYLKKGKRRIAELSSTAKGLPYKNLGYISADFAACFVLMHSFGGGNPHYIELINKSTGHNFLKSGAAWIGADEKKGYLLYCDKDVPQKSDKMVLLNVHTQQRQYFLFPNDIFDEPEILNRIVIVQLTDTKFMIRYDTQRGSKTKVYNRK